MGDGMPPEMGGLDLNSPGMGWRESTADLEPLPEVDQWKVMKDIMYYGSTVWSLFFVSLFIFPGFQSVACAKGPLASIGNPWYRLILMTIFNCTDLGGRLLAPYFLPCIKDSMLATAAFLRLGLIPLFYMFVYETIDWWWGPGVFTFVLGITNGLFGSICMMKGPQLCETHEKEMAGTLMAFCLMMGIICGSFLQLGAGQLLRKDGIGDCLGPNGANVVNNTAGFF